VELNNKHDDLRVENIPPLHCTSRRGGISSARKHWVTRILLVLSISLHSQTINEYDLLITEIMSDPNPTVGLPDDEYLEIYNSSNSTIELADILITIGSKEFEPDSFTLQPDSFKVFWDEVIPTLKNGGDSIILFNEGNLIHRVDYKPSMHESGFKENGGWSLELIDFSKPCLNYGNWTSSNNLSGGTPGFQNSVIQNLPPEPIKLTNFFPISDSVLKLEFNVPIESLEIESDYSLSLNSANISIPALDSFGLDSIQIVNAKTCYESNFTQQTVIYGLPHKVDSGDIIISEILFNPDSEGSDFIEVYNNSSKPINLTQLLFCKRDNNGELEEGYQISNNNRLILPGEYKVICPDINWLEKAFPKTLNTIESKIPSMNNDEGVIVLVNKSGQEHDEIHYLEDWHYGELNDHENVSLEKIDLKGHNIKSNWASAASTEAYATPGYRNSNHYSPNSSQNHFTTTYEIITPNGDGYHDQLILEYNFDDDGWTGKIDILNYSGITIHNLSLNSLFGKNGTVVWNGQLESGSYITPGIYVAFVDAFHIEKQERVRQKITFYVNGNMK